MSLLRELDSREATDLSSAPVNLITGFPAPKTAPGTSLIITAVVMMFLTGAWTIMRIVARKIRKLPFAIEDYLYFAGFAIFWATALGFILAVIVGAGNDMNRLGPEHLAYYAKIALAVQVLYGVALGFIKLSIICMLRRIFRTTGRLFLAAI